MIRRVWIILLLAVVGLLAWAVWHYRSRSPELALPSLTGADPAVVEAIEKARDEVLRQPTSAAARGHLGMVLLANAFVQDAAPHLEQAARLDPEQPLWPYLLAISMEADPDRAIELLRRSADLAESTNFTPRLALGEMYVQEARLDEAEHAFGQVASQRPDDARARLGQARVFLARGQPDQALALLRKLEQESPRRDVLNLLSQVQFRQGAGADAEATRARAATLPDDPPWPDPFRDQLAERMVSKDTQTFRLASLQKAGRSGEADDLRQQLDRNHPELPHLAAARHHREKGNLAEAERAYRMALEQAPTSSEARQELGELLRQQKKYAEAAEQFHFLLERTPTHGPALLALGGCAAARGKHAEAVRFLQKAVTSMPSSAVAHRDLAIALRETGERQEALRHLRLALQLDPKDEKARGLLEAWTR
jgi:tetratricopeptide (TPR) repeat protein